MTMTTTRRHPSDILYNGEARGFAHAIGLLDDAMTMEVVQAARWGEDAPLRAEQTKLRGSLDDARAIYHAHVLAAAREMQQSADGWVSLIGACLESGDYSRLAI
jgi:hypothetical protein